MATACLVEAELGSAESRDTRLRLRDNEKVRTTTTAVINPIHQRASADGVWTSGPWRDGPVHLWDVAGLTVWVRLQRRSGEL